MKIFRAWNKVTNTMHLFINSVDNWSFNYLNQDVFIWLQFTGLKDKNNVEIYEGDILQIHDPELDDGMGPNYKRRLVEWKSGAFILEWDYGEYDITYLGWALEWFSQRDMTVEIIGNQYEHPHLIK
jgi:uncharacterized phage protein (TIGR01671 family)